MTSPTPRPVQRPRRRHRTLLLACALAGALGSFSACFPSTPSRQSSEDRLTEPATFATAYDPEFESRALDAMAGLGIVVMPDQYRTDSYGTWRPLTLVADAPLLDLADTVVAPGVDRTVWDDQTLHRAWQALAGFIVTEWLDSELAWDDTPGNRSALTERLKTGGFFSVDADGKPAQIETLAPAESSTAGLSYWGPFLVDQDFGRWRQTGILLPRPADPTAIVSDALVAEAQAMIAPAEPVPYVIGQPRTIVDYLKLNSVTTVPDTPGTEASFEVSLRYYRPVVMKGIGVPVYEWDSARVTFALSLDGATPRCLGVTSFWAERRDVSLLRGEQLSRLPLLDAVRAASPGQGPVQTLGHITFTPPDTARPCDATCQAGSPWKLEPPTVGFTLPPASTDMPGRLYATVTPGGGFYDTWLLGPGTTTWGFALGPLVGGIDVRSTDYGDEVTLEFVEPDQLSYDIRATVPAGTGEDFAARLVSTMTYTRPSAGPRATATVTPTP